jgi:apolipoprotein N-acyltransferase
MQASKPASINPPRPAQARLENERLSWPATFMLSLAHAILFALMLPPFDLWFTAFLAPLPLAWLALNARTARIAMSAAFVAQLLMWLWLLRWIVNVTFIGYPALALYLALYGAAFVVLLRFLHRTRTIGRLPMAVLVPFVWTAVEFFRGDVLFDGYPWYLLGHPLIAFPLLVQSADLFGTYFISFLVAMFAGAILDVVLLARPFNQGRRRTVIASALLGALAMLANVIYGVWRINQSLEPALGPRILAIQTNLSQDNKLGWPEEAQARDVPRFIEQTRQAQANVNADLIVWPETMVPGLGFEPDLLENLRIIRREEFYRWPDAVLALSKNLQTPMLVGIESWVNTKLVHESETRVRVEREFTYNSSVLLQGDPPFQRYDKSFLTPFGETMPYISAWPWLERLLLNIGVGANLSFELDSNPDIRIINFQWKPASGGAPAVARLATPICFEDTVARLCRRMAYRGGQKRIDAFVNISNDGWFTFSQADRKLHAQIARFRCIENRVPMVRCVNTGMSIWIDSNGRLIAAAGGEGYGVANKPGFLAADLKFDSRASWYGRIGELWPWSCLAVTAIAVVWILIFRKQEPKR